MAARTTKTNITDKWRERIKSGVIIDRLLKHVSGALEMSNTQVKAADILLKKTLPDLARTEFSPEGSGKMTITWEK